MSDAAPYAFFFGSMGVSCALVFAVLGAAYGTAKAAVGVGTMGVMRPNMVMKGTLPVVMAGIIGIYGLIIALILAMNLKVDQYSAFKGFTDLGAGLCVGLSGLAAGMSIGVIGDSGVRAAAQQPKLFTSMVLMLIFAEALALYGLIIGLIMALKKAS